MTDLASVLSDRSEAEWVRLARLLDLSTGFWLGFIFSPSVREALILKTRTHDIISAAGRAFHTISPREPEELAVLYQSLVKMVDVGCVWVVALHVDPPHSLKTPWRDAWDNLFLRLNERRDLIRRQFKGGLVFVAPPEMKPRIREMAPDTWHVMSIELDLIPRVQMKDLSDRSQSDQRVPMGGSSEPPDVSTNSQGFNVFSAVENTKTGSYDLGKIFRTQPTLDPAFALSMARIVTVDHAASKAFPLLDAAKGLFDAGEIDRAKTLAEEALGLIRTERVAEGRADMLAETRARALLAEILCKMGDFSTAREHIRVAITERRAIAVDEIPLYWFAMAGEIEFLTKNFNAAIAMYRDGLRVLDNDRRRSEVEVSRERIYLHAQLGCGYLSMNEFDAAVDEFLRAISFTQTLLLNGYPAMAVVMSVVLKWLGDTWHIKGHSVNAESAYREAVLLDRETLENQPDSIVAMRELSIALNRLGSVLRESDDYEDLQEACSAFEEALGMRRAIVNKQRDRVSLQDLLSSLKKVRAIKRRVVRSKKAFISEVDPLTVEIDEITAEIRDRASH